jgi:hypothetical protein
MPGHLLAVEIGELTKRYAIGDAFAQLTIIPVLQAHQNQRAQHLRRGEATAAMVRLPEAAYQIAPHPLDQRRLPIEKITDRLQHRLKPHALPQQGNRRFHRSAPIDPVLLRPPRSGEAWPGIVGERNHERRESAGRRHTSCGLGCQN